MGLAWVIVLGLGIGGRPSFARRMFCFANCIGQALVGMVDLTLHVQNRDAGGRGNVIKVLIANTPIYMANGDPVKVSAENLT